MGKANTAAPEVAEDIVVAEAVETAPEDDGQGFAVMPNSNAKMTVPDAEARRRTLLSYYAEEEKVPMYLTPMYRPYFGNVMTVTINGISIRFRVDGSTQMIPRTFADEIDSRRIAIDATIAKQTKMSAVQSNIENSPGELTLF